MNRMVERVYFFTLIELLVVITIIVILTSMLLSVLATARATAKAAVCMGNLKGIGLAVTNYCYDSNGWFFSTDNDTNCWTITLEKNNYFNNWKSMLCPMLNYNDYTASNDTYRRRILTYGAIFRSEMAATFPGLLNLQKEKSPANSMISGDSWRGDSNFMSPHFLMDWSNTYGNPYMVHKQRANFIMVDGHVEPATLQSLLAGHPYWQNSTLGSPYYAGLTFKYVVYPPANKRLQIR